nr:PREDICTED: uncharacterized protein LOC106702138 [Latimeria chalumnae]|eukprot:XP_014339761.1 PREDICTED: uncharacterized protein LOC106702138 [Latimeria chalumnae]
MLQRLRDILRATESGHMSPYVFTNHTLAKIYNRNKGGVCNNTGDNIDKCKVLQCRATGAQNTIMHCTGYTSNKSSHSMGKRTSTHLSNFEGGRIVQLDYGTNFTHWAVGNCVDVNGTHEEVFTIVTRGTWHKYCQCLEWWETPCEEKTSMAYQKFLRMARVTPVHLGVDLAGTRINLTHVISAPILDPQEGSIIQMARLPYRTGSFVIVAKQPIIHLFQPLHSNTLFEVHREECKSEGSFLACPYGAILPTPYNETDMEIVVMRDSETWVVYTGFRGVCISMPENTMVINETQHNILGPNFCIFFFFFN